MKNFCYNNCCGQVTGLLQQVNQRRRASVPYWPELLFLSILLWLIYKHLHHCSPKLFRSPTSKPVNRRTSQSILAFLACIWIERNISTEVFIEIQLLVIEHALKNITFNVCFCLFVVGVFFFWGGGTFTRGNLEEHFLQRKSKFALDSDLHRKIFHLPQL